MEQREYEMPDFPPLVEIRIRPELQAAMWAMYRRAAAADPTLAPRLLRGEVPQAGEQPPGGEQGKQ